MNPAVPPSHFADQFGWCCLVRETESVSYQMTPDRTGDLVLQPVCSVAYFLHIAGRMPIGGSWSVLLPDGRRQVSHVMDIRAQGSLGELIPLLSDPRFELDPAWLVQSAIAGARKQSGLTRSAFAAALGVSVHLLDLWEHGEAMPPADRLVRALRLAEPR